MSLQSTMVSGTLLSQVFVKYINTNVLNYLVDGLVLQRGVGWPTTTTVVFAAWHLMDAVRTAKSLGMTVHWVTTCFLS